MAIFKKRGVWWIGYRLNGKRRRESVGASHSLAKEVLAKRLAEAAERKHFPGRSANAALFTVVAEKFWKLHGQHLRSRSWRYTLDIFIDRFGSRKIGQISVAEIQAFYNEIASRGRPGSPSTANRHLTLLSSVFGKAKSWGDFYGDNPCAAVRRQREANHRLRYLSQNEIDRLMRAAHPRLQPVLACAIMTGMRKGELLQLAWESVDLERQVIFILKSKSGRPREIPIAGLLKVILAGLGPRTNGSVFDLPDIMLRRYFDRALKDAKIEAFRFHDLRHTFASHFLMRTGDLPTLQRLLGHSTPILTLRYAHLSQAHIAAGMAVFEAGMALGAPETAGQGSGANPRVVSQEPEALPSVGLN